jgi:hypothetical protein
MDFSDCLAEPVGMPASVALSLSALAKTAGGLQGLKMMGRRGVASLFAACFCRCEPKVLVSKELQLKNYGLYVMAGHRQALPSGPMISILHGTFLPGPAPA